MNIKNTIKIKLINGDIMTLPLINGLYNWDSILFHLELLIKNRS